MVILTEQVKIDGQWQDLISIQRKTVHIGGSPGCDQVDKRSIQGWRLKSAEEVISAK